jgi:glutamyl-tRNA reductase
MIFAAGISFKTAPVALREQLAVAPSRLVETAIRLKQQGGLSELALVSTCNRVELYGVSDHAEGLVDLFASLARTPVNVSPYVYVHAGEDAARHLFAVASGLDSMVLGETEILGQLKKAYDTALRHRQTGGQLNKIFQKAFNVAKQIRTETNIQRGSVSVASVAVELAEKIFSSLPDHPVLVIGAGDTGEKTARALLSRGARRILVSNRSRERAEALALELGGRAVAFEDWAAEFSGIDIVISSTAAPHYILDRAKLEGLMKARKQRPLLLIDIAVPRDIDPEIQLLENVYLYNMDDLQEIAGDYLRQRQDEIARCQAVIRDKARALLLPAPGRLVDGSKLAPGGT